MARWPQDQRLRRYRLPIDGAFYQRPLALGVTPGLLAQDRPAVLRGAAAEQVSARVHRFARLEIGAEPIRNPEIMVADLRLSDADLVLGIDLLRPQRIWLSYGSQKIFLLRRS